MPESLASLVRRIRSQYGTNHLFNDLSIIPRLYLENSFCLGESLKISLYYNLGIFIVYDYLYYDEYGMDIFWSCILV